MDKTLRNVIIFAAVILVIAAAFTVITLTKQYSGSNSIAQTTQNNLGNNGNNANTQTNTATNGEVQNVKLSVSGGTYILTPSVLKKDVPVRLEADMATLRGCSRSVVIAAFGVRKTLTDSDNVITFTPTQTGTINIACSMNMYRGTFTVVDGGSASSGTNLQAASSAEPSQTPSTTATLASTPSTSNGGGCTMGANGGGCGCGG